MATIKMSVNLPEETVNSLRELAKSKGITMTEALRQAIANDKYLNDAQAEGSKILVNSKDGKDTKQLVFR